MAAPLARLVTWRAQQFTSLRCLQPAMQQWSPLRHAHAQPGWQRCLASTTAGGGAGGSSASSGDEVAQAAGNMGVLIDDQTDLETTDSDVLPNSTAPGAASTAAADGAAAAEPLSPGLYIVSTPIGNLEDITLRALRVLRCAHLVLAEDTRRTAQLLNHFGIRTPLSSYHQHNERRKEAQVLRQLQQGAAIALVSDAGTPAINDPGADLVAAAAAASLPVIPVPGPSAVLAAVVASGLPTAQFLYCGFTAPKPGARRKQFGRLVGQEATLVFFVSPHSLLGALEDAAEVLGPERRCCLARELTKRHEEFWRGSLAEALQEFTERGPRGEFVLLIEGGIAEAAAGAAGAGGEVGEEQIVAALREAVAAGESPSSAAKSVALRLGQNRKLCYRLSLSLEAGGEP